MTHAGELLSPDRFVPIDKSKIAPTHVELPDDSRPRFISLGLMGHAFPPNASVMLTDDEHAKNG